jgi:hypothetical protein
MAVGFGSDRRAPAPTSARRERATAQRNAEPRRLPFWAQGVGAGLVFCLVAATHLSKTLLKNK